MRRVNSIVMKLALIAVVIATAVVAAAHWLPAGRLAEKSDILTAFTGHIAVGAVAALAALYFRRAAFAILVSGVAVAFVGHIALARTKQVQVIWPIVEARTTGDRLRVYELNVWDHLPDIPRLERAIAAVDADVVVLVEVEATKLKMIERLKAQFPFQQACATRWTCEVAILSRLPIIDGKGFRTNHMLPPVVWARIDASSRGMGEVTVIGTHVYRPTRNAWLHATQMQSLAGIVSSAKPPVIVVGDLNTGPWSAAYGRLIRSANLVPTAGLLPTWPAYPLEVPQVSLDHILVSPDLTAVRSGLGPATGSDHLPVFAEIIRKTEIASRSK